MAQEIYWNTDEAVEADDFAALVKRLAGNHVVSGYTYDSAAGLDVTIVAGEAVVGGFRIVDDAALAAITVADDDESWIFLNSDGTLSTNTTGITPADAVPLVKVTAATGAITDNTDIRPTNGTVADLLETLTTKGDILYRAANNALARLGIGSEGQALVASASGVPQWGAGGPNVQSFESSGTWTKPASGTTVLVLAWGGGGGGGGGASEGCGGGGGAFVFAFIDIDNLGATESVTVAAGGTSPSNGTSGGSTSFGSFVTAYGGGGGNENSQSGTGFNGGGGGGGGVYSAGGGGGGITSSGAGGDPDGGAAVGSEGGSVAGEDSLFGGGSGGFANAGGRSVYGGGGGGGADNTTPFDYDGGDSIWGGGGGGSASAHGGTGGSGGSSACGGNGGDAGQDGGFPAGGGGAGGAGGAGWCIAITF